MTYLQNLKTVKLTDLIRRCIANPTNIREVAEAIASDWHPPFTVNPDGSTQIKLSKGGSGS